MSTAYPRRLGPLAALVLALIMACEPDASAPAEAPDPPPAVAEEEAPPEDELAQAEQGRDAQEGDEQPALGPGTEPQQQLMVRAKAAFLRGDTAAAEPLFAELAGSEPVSSPQVSAAIALGDIYASSGREDKALALYEDLLERAGPVPEVHLMVGRIHRDRGRLDEAIAAYERTLEIQPLYVFLWVELGQLRAQQGDTEASAQAMLTYERKVYALAKELGATEQTALADRLQIIDVFSLVEDDRATQALLEVLREDPAFEARAAAARALGDVQSVAARPTLETIAASDPSDRVRAAARAALQKLEGIEAPGEGDVAAPTRVEGRDELPE